MYAVIHDVTSYPEFLPWCVDALIKEENDALQVAELKVAYKRLALTFSTSNALVKDESISMSLISGPFKTLSGQWMLQTLDEHACKVSLEMTFAFANPVTHALFGRVFHSVVSAQVDAFQKRAEQIYGV